MSKEYSFIYTDGDSDNAEGNLLALPKPVACRGPFTHSINSQNGGLVKRRRVKGRSRIGFMVLRKEDISLISGDADIVDIAQKEGNHVISLDEVGPAARPVTIPGERFFVSMADNRQISKSITTSGGVLSSLPVQKGQNPPTIGFFSVLNCAWNSNAASATCPRRPTSTIG